MLCLYTLFLVKENSYLKGAHSDSSHCTVIYLRLTSEEVFSLGSKSKNQRLSEILL